MKHHNMSKDEAIKALRRRQTTFSLEKCIMKYGEEKGKMIWRNRQEKWIHNYRKRSYSLVSQNLFWQLFNLVDMHEDVYFATLDSEKNEDYSGKNHEYRIYDYEKGKVYMPDFKIGHKIIEFDGVYFHQDTERDKIRDDNLKELGYTILHVSEADWKKCDKKIIRKCLNFINDND